MRREPSEIKKLIIHCSASPNGVHHTALDIDHWHAERGFKRNAMDIGNHQPNLKHIGYHFVVQTNGGLANGRHELEIGAHCQGHNKDSVGICLIGTDKFTHDQWNTLEEFVLSFGRRYPHATIHGHNEFAAKACPGFNVADWLEAGLRYLKGHVCAAMPVTNSGATR